MSHIWKPAKMRGKDGKDYWVYTSYGAGRGWYHRMYHTPLDDQYREIDVHVLHKGPRDKGVSVVLSNIPDFNVVSFSRNPYVKKDGTFSVKQLITMHNGEIYSQKMKAIYGIVHYFKFGEEDGGRPYWPLELSTWYNQDYEYLNSLQEAYIAEIEKNQIH
jgi:hypothetical protein